MNKTRRGANVTGKETEYNLFMDVVSQSQQICNNYACDFVVQ